MILSIFDTCLLFNKDITTIIGLQTDDSLITDIIGFMEIELRELNIVGLMTKSCEGLVTDYSLDFNDFIITLNDDNNMIINQLK